MPTYEYVCRECEFTFEEFQRITADSLVDCPRCGKPSLRRRMGGGGGMIFKGTGFYQTDYVRKNGGSESTTSKSSEKTSPSTETKSTASPKPDTGTPKADTGTKES